jgi:hypothetical protein
MHFSTRKAAKLISTAVEKHFYNCKTYVLRPWKCFFTVVKNENAAYELKECVLVVGRMHTCKRKNV